MKPSVQFIPSLSFSLKVFLLLPLAVAGTMAVPLKTQDAQAQVARDNRPLTVRADIQEANSKTGVVTARGNVQIFYPARQIQATAAQAQYFSRERRIVLSGNVYVLQQGNSLRGETIVYLIDEGRFVAIPRSNQQVESVYLVSDPEISESGSSSSNR
jgi:lipopolysaccharide export system protein LptA